MNLTIGNKMKFTHIVILGIGSIVLFSGCGASKPQITSMLENAKFPDSKLRCARMKNGTLIQTYDGTLRDNQIWINNKNFTRKYKLTKTPYENLAKSGQKGHFCNIVDKNTQKKDLSSSNTKLRCARMKNGILIQTYNGILKDNQIWINNKNFTNKYKITKTPYEELSKSGKKGHFCNIIK